MSRYLLDTNAWLHFFEQPERLSAAARKALADESRFAISAISVVEVAQKVAKGRLNLRMPLERWVETSLGNFADLMPITPSVAIEAYCIGDFHGDPADRIIAATARLHDLTLVTSDRKLLAHPGVRTLAA